MPVIRGDRISESARLNRRSVEAQDFYALLVSKVPDDFLRFRVAPILIIGALYPRREPTTALVKRVARLLEELGTPLPDGGPGAAPLWKTWVCDGVTFAELTTGRPRQKRFHKTPEPPWSDHEHNGACIKTALARARDWGTDLERDALLIRLKELRDQKQGQKPPSPSAPSSPGSSSSPSASSAPSSPTDQRKVAAAGEAPAKAAEPPPPPDEDSPDEDSGDLALLRRQVDAVLVAIEPDDGDARTAELVEASRTDRGKTFTAVGECNSVGWLRVTLDKLRARQVERGLGMEGAARGALASDPAMFWIRERQRRESGGGEKPG